MKKASKLYHLYFLLASSLALVLWLNSEGNKVKASLYSAGYNLYAGASDFISRLYAYTSLQDGNIHDVELLREKKYLEQKNAVLQEENKLLKSKLNLIDNRNYKHITAVVTQITYPKDEIAFVLSAGEKDGIAIGNIVVNEEGVVGRISRTTAKFSVVSLLGSENVKVSSLILPSYQDCIVSGKATEKDSLLKINYLQNTEDLRDGDEVISSGKDGMTPFGLRIGDIKKISGKIFVSPKKILHSTIVKIIVYDGGHNFAHID